VTDILSLGDVSKNNAVRTVHVQHPRKLTPLYSDGADGKPDKSKPIQIKIVGGESDDAQKANHANRKRLNQRSMMGEDYDPTVEDENLFYFMACCTKGWDNVPTAWLTGKDDEQGREPLAFDEDTAQKVYARLGWLRGQVIKGIWKREPFDEAS
jgi:hypothetical protein